MLGKFSNDLLNAGRGLLMGGADIIPGVSGGTVALILGIYERFVTAISHVDLKLMAHLRHREWTAAALHVDLRFLVSLLLGIGIGIVSLARLMRYLLEHQPLPTWSLFFGLIFASSVLVARMIERWNVVTVVCGIVGAGFAYWLMGQLPATGPDSLIYLFACGMVAICAMILPGISGAFILVILGNYANVTRAIDEFVHGCTDSLRLTASGDFSAAIDELGALGPQVTMLTVFAIGCGLGLIGFSKFLRWLLARHEPQTMALLCGFMFGSLRKIWPFKIDLTPGISDPKKKLFENGLPVTFGGEVDVSNTQVAVAIGLAIGAILVVFIADWLTRGHEHVPPLEPADHEPRIDA